MTLLLDTHTIVWLTEDLPSLGRAARRKCDAALATSDIAVATLTFYEIGRAMLRGRIRIAPSLRDWRVGILALGVREVPLSAEIATRAADLENLSGDPLDRFLIATALVEEAVLLTADRRILDWPGRVRREDARR